MRTSLAKNSLGVKCRVMVKLCGVSVDSESLYSTLVRCLRAFSSFSFMCDSKQFKKKVRSYASTDDWVIFQGSEPEVRKWLKVCEELVLLGPFFVSEVLIEFLEFVFSGSSGSIDEVINLLAVRG